jgi:adenylate kinase family enzyme
VKRVMVVGGPGSGKSTLAVALGEITALPVFHMDQIHYKPGWIERTRDAKIAAALAIEARDEWIFEGGLSATYASRCARADTVIWLDLPVTLRLRRIVKRRVQYHGQTRPDLPDNCPERLAPEFLAYILRTRQSARENIAQTIAAAPHLALHHIRTAKGADTWLDWCRDELLHTN